MKSKNIYVLYTDYLTSIQNNKIFIKKKKLWKEVKK